MQLVTKSRRLVTSLISFALILSLSLTSNATFARASLAQQQTRTNRPFPTARYIPDHDFDTRHIALDLRFNWEKEELLGRETLVFAPLIPNLTTIKLDGVNITPTQIKLGATNLQFVT